MKLENQLIKVRKEYKDHYYKEHFKNIKNVSNNSEHNSQEINSKDIKIQKSNNTKVHINNPERNKTLDADVNKLNINKLNIKSKKIKKKSILIVGDSLVNGIEESKLSKTRHIRVQPIPGGDIDDIRSNFDELLHKDLQKIIVHIGANNAVKDSAEDIFNNIILLKNNIEELLPNCEVFLSSLVKRTDDVKANNVAREVNYLLKASKMKLVINDNITEEHLGKRGLHLNQSGNVLLASNMLNAIRSCNVEKLKVSNDINKVDNYEIKGDHNNVISNTESDILSLMKIRKELPNNPNICYLNINSLGNKIDGIREFCFKIPVDIFCVDETKLDSSYPDSQFYISGYQFPPIRKDRNKNGGGKLIYIRDGILAKRLESLEKENIETICLEITLSKKKW